MDTEMMEQVPAFLKIKADITEKIKSGKLVPGQRLQAERTLALRYKVSRDTIRRVLKELCDGQIVRRVQGSGTYVNDINQNSAGKIAAIYYNRHTAGDGHTFSAVSNLVRQAKHTGSEILLYTCDSEKELKKHLAECNERADLKGGIVLSVNTTEEIKLMRQYCNHPLVLLGDIAAMDRGLPLLNQVIGNNHTIGNAAGLGLMERGCRSLAMLAVNRLHVWNKELIEGYLDSIAGSSITNIGVSVLQDDNDYQSGLKSPDVLDMLKWANGLVDDWLQRECIPDGIFAADIWLMQVLVHAFTHKNIDPTHFPIFAVLGSDNKPGEVPSDVNWFSISPDKEKHIQRCIARLDEIAGGDKSIRLEVLDDLITKSETCENTSN